MIGNTTGALIACGVLLMLWLGVRRWRRRRATLACTHFEREDGGRAYMPAVDKGALSPEPSAAVAPPCSSGGASLQPAPAGEMATAVAGHADTTRTAPQIARASLSSRAARRGPATTLDWDDHDLDFIETSAAEQHELRTAVAPVTLIEDEFTGDHDESRGPSPAISDSGPATFALNGESLNGLATEANSFDDAVPAEPVRPDRPAPDSYSSEPPSEMPPGYALGQLSVTDVSPAKDGGYFAEANGAQAKHAIPRDEPDTSAIAAPWLETELFESLADADALETVDESDTEFGDDLELFDALPDLWAIEGTDEDDEAPLYEVDIGGDRLGEYDKAKRLASQTVRRFDADADDLWPVLLDIFQESPWPITQRSIERLLAAGVSCQALALAADLRRVWRDHPEFGQSFPIAHVRGESWMFTQEAMSQLSWPRAARLADCWPSYPDPAEIECFLEDLFDRWHANNAKQRSFSSFQLYLGYATGYLDGTLQDSPELCFEADGALEDPFEALDSSEAWPPAFEDLERYGIKRPMTTRPVYIYDGSPPGDERRHEKSSGPK